MLEYKILGAAIATLGWIGAGIGLGIMFSGLLNAMSRNPSMKDELFSKAFLLFALIEATGLFAYVMAFVLLFAF